MQRLLSSPGGKGGGNIGEQIGENILRYSQMRSHEVYKGILTVSTALLPLILF